jgi:hypothetical protein
MHYIAMLDTRSGRPTLSEVTGDPVDAIQRRRIRKTPDWPERCLGDLSFAPSSEISSIEHDTKQVRRYEGKLSGS